jgi:CheY-like chemotaxis protein
MSKSRRMTIGIFALALASVLGLGVVVYMRDQLDATGVAWLLAASAALACGVVRGQRQLDERDRAVTAANQAHRDLLAKISHELRTPLNAIVGWTEILKVDRGENRVRAIEAIERNAFAQAQLIDDVLGAPKLRAGPAAVRKAERPLDLRILVVEDDEDSAVTLRTLLTERGCDVRVARTVHECLELYPLARPDVLLCDIGLPDGDGFGLLRALRTASGSPEVPAIALSALTGEEDRARAADVGFADYVTKPYRVDDLIAHIRRVAVSARPLPAPGWGR